MLQTLHLKPMAQNRSGVPQPVEWLTNGALRLVDQTLLPLELKFLDIQTVHELADAISSLKVRGAPSIGVAAAYGLCLAAHTSTASDGATLLNELQSAARVLRETRPTAVNLAWALDKVLEASAAAPREVRLIQESVFVTAQRIDKDNREANRRIGEHGATLLKDGMQVLTHCNTGPLAAGGIGTALGVIYTAHEQGKRIQVWVDETRPLLQGARITTWELGLWGVSCTLIADNMAASLMRAGRMDAVLVGADRIAANGDVANKIGTYGLAVLAHAHNIPFYVLAPGSTVDLDMPDGSGISIEQRNPSEITHHGGKRSAPEGVAVYNPAFDVTPSHLIDRIITEAGVFTPQEIGKSKLGE